MVIKNKRLLKTFIFLGIFIEDMSYLFDNNCQMGKTVEEVILNSAYRNCEKKFYGGYYETIGGHYNLGKTYEKCLNHVLNELKKVNCIKIGDRDVMDIVSIINKETIAIQTKTGPKLKRSTVLARIDYEDKQKSYEENLDKKIEIYYKKIDDFMHLNNVDKCYALYHAFDEGKIYLVKLSEKINGKIFHYNKKRENFSYTKGQTLLNFKFKNCDEIKTKDCRKLPEIDHSSKKTKKKLSSTETVYSEIKKFTKIFCELENLLLGPKWGDKGQAYEVMFCKYMSNRYYNTKRGKGIVDFVVKDLGCFQLKTHHERNLKALVFSRSSAGENPVDELGINFEWNVPRQINYSPAEERRVDIENRIKKSLIDNDEKNYFLATVCMNRKFLNPKNENIYKLAELGEDGKTLKKRGTFLINKKYYRSDGGSNGLQTHFHITMSGLESDLIQKDNDF